jgi:methionyl-tRNA synthetase
MPNSATKIWNALGLESYKIDYNIFTWKTEIKDVETKKIEQIFPRIEVTKEDKQEQKNRENKMEELITIDDFFKIKLKVGKVIEAERVKGSEKLIKLIVDIGERRQIVAGIGKSYCPEELLGKSIIVVSNLKPAKLMGLESQGMLLAATSSDGTISILTVDREVTPGSGIK